MTTVTVYRIQPAYRLRKPACITYDEILRLSQRETRPLRSGTAWASRAGPAWEGNDDGRTRAKKRRRPRGTGLE